MKIMLGCPCAKDINTTTASCIQSLGIPTVYVTDSLVYDAREEIVKIAIEKEYDYVLFVDSDMVFEVSDLENLLSDDKDIITGLYFERKGNHRPVIYKEVYVTENLKCCCDKYNELPKERLFNIGACGMGFCLIKTEILKAIRDNYNNCFMPLGNFGEDLSFCWKATQLGFDIYCDKEVKLGHIGEYIYTEKDWKK